MEPTLELLPGLGTAEIAHESPFEADFDQFQRYSAAALLLKPLLKALGRPARILEIGSNHVTLLRRFLAPLPVELYRCDVRDCGSGAADFIPVAQDQPLPFGDDQFDFGVALEVLEHIAPEDRPFAVSEWLRVASHGVLLTCPNGLPEVQAAERRAEQAYRRRRGRSHDWLHEHEEFGLPTPQELAGLFDKLGVPVVALDNSPLAEWLPLLLLSEELTETSSPEVLARFNRLLNQSDRHRSRGSVAYRQVYFAFKTTEERESAVSLWHGVARPESSTDVADTAVTPVEDSGRATLIDPMVQLAGVLREVFRRQGEELEREAKKAASVPALLRALGEERCRARDLERDLRQNLLELQAVRSSRVRRWVTLARRAWRRRSKPLELSPSNLHRLSRERWESFGAEGHFILEQPTPAGWVRIEVGGHFPADVISKLHYDQGAGFSEHDWIMLGPWPAYPHRHVRFHYLDRPVKAWQLRPLDRSGVFDLGVLEVRPCSRKRVLFSGLIEHLRECRKPSLLWRKLRKAGASLLRSSQPLSKQVISRAAPAAGISGYRAWLQGQRLSETERDRLRAAIGPPSDGPRVSVLLSLVSIQGERLQRTLDSLAAQSFDDWELLVAAPGACHAELRRRIDGAPGLPKRTEWCACPLPASAALNHLVERAKGQFVVLVDPGDELEPDALLLLADAMGGQDEADCVYSDEDLLHPEAGCCQPHFKPDWSPERFLADGYVGRLAAYRTASVRAVGGFRAVHDGAHEFDLLLRLTNGRPDCVRHISRVLYHRSGLGVRPWAEPDAMNQVRALADPPLPVGAPKVSIIIPTAGRCALIRGKSTTYLAHCVESIRSRSSHPHYEIIAVDNGDLSGELIRLLDQLDVRRITHAKPFNLAGKMNLGAARATGDYLVFLNDDTEVLTPDWLERMLEYARRPGVGAVGAKLFFPDGRLQHVGVHVLDGNPGHPFYRAPGAHPGYFGSAVTPRNCLAVTGACLMTRRAIFQSLGGFDERFPLNYNDVDYCLRLHERGLRSVFTPFAELYHFEAVSKEGGASVRPAEIRLFHKVWKNRVPRDPYYNDNLCPRHGDYRMRK